MLVVVVGPAKTVRKARAAGAEVAAGAAVRGVAVPLATVAAGPVVVARAEYFRIPRVSRQEESAGD